MKIDSGRMLNDYISPNKKQYCIPVFQREYAWSFDQCDKLFEDIVLAYKMDRPHFCGSFVYAPLDSRNHIDYFIIIDGQQRYTTLYILLKALADSAADEGDKDAIMRYLFNEDRFDRYGIDEKSKLKLKPVKTDNDQLQLLMLDKIDEMDKSTSGIIYHNYMHFRSLVDQFLQEKEDNSVRMIVDGIDHLICADIRLEMEDDAQEIFERINSTGIKLRLPDLIRNYVLMRDSDQNRLFEEYWLVAQETLPREKIEDFFLDYINLKLDGFTKESCAYADFKRIYQDGKYTNETMLTEILHYARQYHTFYFGDESLSYEINDSLLGLRKLNQTTIFLFLFRLFDDYENEVIDQQELGKILKMLLSYSIRRMICEIGSNSLRGLYKSLYNRVFVNSEHKNHYYDAIVSFLQQITSKDAIPSDEDFALALRWRNLYRKNALCKYLLANIENQGKEKIVIDNLTIEHVMPQNENLSTVWQKMLGDDWMSVRDRYLHTLGNLTLTGYNSELGDLPFDAKKEKLVEMATKVVVLNNDVINSDVWNSESMDNHAERLIGEILKLFPIEPAKEKIEFLDPRYSLYTVADPSNATYKYVNYYELLGERVTVDSFAQMVRSVSEKLYDLDNLPIERMASNNEKFPGWGVPVFSYDEGVLRNPLRLKKGSDIYISSSYSASDCICFIRALLRLYEINLEEDFVYSARPSNGKERELNRTDVIKKWCALAQDKGLVGFDPINSSPTLIRFTTPYLDSIIPLSTDKMSPWNTMNFYFYEIVNRKGLMTVKLYFYCKRISPEMREVFTRLAKILELGELEKGYMLYFQTSTFQHTDEDTEKSLFFQLDTLFAEIQAFENKVSEEWT